LRLFSRFSRSSRESWSSSKFKKVQEMANEVQNLYHKASMAVERYLEAHRGETFDLDTICRHMEIRDAHKRDLVNQCLLYQVKKGLLEKNNRSYRYIDRSIIRMNLRDSLGAVNVPLEWPTGIDGTHFGFDGHISIPEKALIVLAGVTNTGKSVFMRNLCYKNFDAHHCLYFSSETSVDDFADYSARMTWANPFNDDGTDKFELIWQEKDFKYAIKPNGINLIDWLNIYDNFYQIGEVLDGIKGVLDKGIVVVAIQKDPQKGLGVGGMWAEHKASLYMTMDFGRLTVEKAKKWTGINPNHHTWGFDIVDQGTHFSNIRDLIRCPECHGFKTVKGHPCDNCNGSGWADVVIQPVKTDYVQETF
jgi:hypothetical protein